MMSDTPHGIQKEDAPPKTPEQIAAENDLFNSQVCPCEDIEPEPMSEYEVPDEWVTYTGVVNQAIFDYAARIAESEAATPSAPPLDEADLTEDFGEAAEGEAVAVNQEAPAANQEAPAANQETPAANQESPAANQEAPAANQEAPAANQEASAANQEAPVEVEKKE